MSRSLNVVTFVTGNEGKKRQAELAFDPYCDIIDLQFANPYVVEIQSSSSREIVEYKAREAYKKLGRAVLVNDGFWEIPALNGFPGANMKEVMRQFSVNDWRNLMRDHDKTLILTDTLGYCNDGENVVILSKQWKGEFIDVPQGNTGPPINSIVRKVGATTSIAEEYATAEACGETYTYTDVYDKMASWLASRQLSETAQ